MVRKVRKRREKRRDLPRLPRVHDAKSKAAYNRAYYRLVTCKGKKK